MAEATDAVKNGNGGSWSDKAKAAGLFINQVGIPAVIILSLLTYVGAVLVGKVDSPVVTKQQFQDAMTRNLDMHNAIIENARANTKAVEKATRSLERMECKSKPSKDDQLKCLLEID